MQNLYYRVKGGKVWYKNYRDAVYYYNGDYEIEIKSIEDMSVEDIVNIERNNLQDN